MISASNKTLRPTVSIIIPSYNYAHFLGQAIESVQAQTYEHWECIIVDDGSTDDTGALSKRFAERDHRIKYIRQDNRGLAAARNTGIKHSSSDYFQFLDADDLLEYKKLEFQVAYLEQNPDVDIVISDLRCFTTEDMDARLYSRDEDNQPWAIPLIGRRKEVLPQLIRNNPLSPASPLLRRSVVAEIGYFDGSLKGVEDYDYWLRCALKNKNFQYVESAGTYALIRSHATSMIRDSRLILKSMILMHQKLASELSEPHLRRLNQERRIEREGLLGLEEVTRGHTAIGMYHMFKAGLRDNRARSRLKWIWMAFVAPFVGHDRLRRMLSSSITGSVKALFRKSVPNE